jgi:hypothetical protein
MQGNFADAIMQNMVSSLDPNAVASRQAMLEFVKTQKIEANVKKASAITEIGTLLQKAKDEGADSVVIASYQKLMTQLVAD